MKKSLLLLVLATCCSLPLVLSAALEDGDFTAGKGKWRGQGKVETVGGAPALVVALSKNNFTEITQSFKMPATTKGLKVTVVVQASADYVFNDKSRNIANVNFQPGGNYTWSAAVYPKSDFHIRLATDGWYRYNLATVPKGTTTTLVAEIKDVKKPGDLELALVFPAGDGSMMVKRVSVEEMK